MSSFESLGLSAPLLQSLTERGYTAPTPIQSRAIPEVLAGHDLMASAQTGTGKTAAFILPALQRLAVPSTLPGRGPRVLVLTPTRELANQVTEAASAYGRHIPRLKVVSILGGMSYTLQNKLLSQYVDLLVGTPGRLLDHIRRGRLDLSRVEVLVLDEADRMLDLGFAEDVQSIAAATPAQRQTLLFSATLDGSVATLAKRLLKDPRRIEIASAKTRHESIEQRLHFVDDLAHKNRLLAHLLNDIDLRQAIVFTATKRDADALAIDLESQGHAAAALHGDMDQRSRNRTLDRVRRGNVRVLVATDVAARGLDVPAISHVFNYDLPRSAEDYVHRIGRTGRAGEKGIAVSFASMREGFQLQRIERYTGQPIPAHVVQGLEPRRSHARSAKPSGGRPSGGRPGGDRRPAQGQRRESSWKGRSW